MYKIKSATYLIISIVLLTAGGCSDMNSLHQSYLDEGEYIYAPKIDSCHVRPGNNREQLDLYFSTQRIVKGVIYWNQKNDSSIVSFPALNKEVFEVILPEMPEGDYTFELITYDKFGNSSLPLEIIGKVYGDDYIASLLNRSVEVSTEVNEEGVIKTILKWGDAENTYGTHLKYTTIDDNEVEKIIPEEEQETILTDNKPGSTFSYSTAYKPTKLAIDLFYAYYKSVNFPE